jgi:2-dehydropantoate 2-reductase
VAWLRTQAKDRSGIWRDIAVRHRPTEVPTHYRPVLAAAARHDIPVPGLERLVAQIGELEAGAAMAEARIAALTGALR